MPVSTVETHEAIDGGSSKGRRSRTGAWDGLAAQPSARTTPRDLEKRRRLRRESVGRVSQGPSARVGQGEPALAAHPEEDVFVRQPGRLGGAPRTQGGQPARTRAAGPERRPRVLTAFANASTKHRTGAPTCSAAASAPCWRRTASSPPGRNAQWEETTAEGRPIIDAVHRKPTRVGNRMRSATKAIMAGNRLSTFGTGGAAAPGRAARAVPAEDHRRRARVGAP